MATFLLLKRPNTSNCIYLCYSQDDIMSGTEHRREVLFPPDRDSDGAHPIFPGAVAQSLSRMRSAQAPGPKGQVTERPGKVQGHLSSSHL